MIRSRGVLVCLFTILFLLVSSGYSDEKLTELVNAGKYKDAVVYSAKLPVAKRTIDEWVQIAISYEKTKASVDKVKSCYISAQKINPSDPRVYLGFGKVYYAKKDYKNALKNFQRSYILNRSAVAAEGIAKSAYKLKEWDKALDAAESAVNLDKNLYDSRVILLNFYMKRKNYKDAAAQLEVVVKQKPKNLGYWKKLALCYEKTNQKDKFPFVDANIIKLSKKNVKSRLRYAAYLLENKKQDEAYTLYKELAVLSPNNKDVFKNLYTIAAAKKLGKDAILYLKNYLALDSTNADYYKKLANLLYESKDIEGALAAYRKTAKLKPTIKGIYKNYSEIVISKKLDKEIISVVKAAIATKEVDAKMYMALADVYAKSKSYVSAITYYKKVLDLDSKNLAALKSLAAAQAGAKQIKNAIITYQQVVMLDTKAVNEYKILGELSAKNGNKKASINFYKKYLDKAGSDDAVARIIGLNSFSEKRYKEAVKYLTKVKNSKYYSTKYYEALGLSYFAIKDYKNAVAKLSVINKKGQNVSVLKSILKPLAESYEKIGNKESAAVAYSSLTAIPGVVNADASYLKAFLVEGKDVAAAIKIYKKNIVKFPRDYRNFLRLGVINSKNKATLVASSKMLSKASLLNPKDINILRKLSDVYSAIKNTPKLLSTNKKILALSVKDLEANKIVGKILYSKKSYAAAIPKLELVVAGEPDNFDAVFMLAGSYLKMKNYAKSLELYEKAKKLKPDDVTIRLSLIKAAEKLSKKDVVASEKASLAELDKKIISKDKKNIDSRERLANYYFVNGKYKGALPIYKELAILTPKKAIVFKRLFTIESKGGNKKNASLYLANFVAIDSTNAKAYIMLGKMYSSMNDLPKAMAAYKKASKLDPKLKGFYKDYSDVVVKIGKDNEKIAVLKKSIEFKENRNDAYLRLGDIYKKKKMYKSAIAMYNKASASDPKNTKILVSLAECQVGAKLLSAAVLTYEQVVMLNPNASVEYKALGDLKLRLSKKSDAMKAYKKYLAKKSEDSKIALKVGFYEYSKGNFKSAIKYLDMVKSTKAKNTKYYKTLGLAAYNIKDYPKAVSQLTVVTKRKVSQKILVEVLKPLAISFEKVGKKKEAANAYRDYVKLPGVIDSEASFKRAFLREEFDKTTAVAMYKVNLKRFPKDYRNFYRLGVINSEVKDIATLKSAATMLSKASVLAPKNKDILLTLARTYGRLKNVKYELSTYKKLIALDASNLEANRKVGIILAKSKKYSSAIVNLEVVLTQKPKDLEVILVLADCYKRTARLDKAISLLLKAKSIKQNDPEIGSMLYQLYVKTGKASEAEKQIKELISLTKDVKLRAVYAKELIRQKRLDEASAQINEILAKDPASISGLMLKAKVFQVSGKYSDAIEVYKTISYVSENYIPMLYERGLTYLLSGKKDRAKSYFNKVVAKAPKSALGYVGLARLAKANNNTALVTKYVTKAKTIDPSNDELKDFAK